MDATGWRLFAGVRRESDAEDLLGASSGRLVPLILDITDVGQIAGAAEQIAGAVGDQGLQGLVNNAGIIALCPVETVSLDVLRQQLEVNLVGHVAVTQALLPLLRPAAGRIVFVGSVGGRISYPLGGPYNASKYGLEAVVDCLRQELRPWAIDVAVVEPGAIDTPIWDRGEKMFDEMAMQATPAQARLYGEMMDRSWAMGEKLQSHASPAEKVAKTIGRALTARRVRVRYTVGADARAQQLAHRLIPGRAYDWIVAKSLGI
jgi:NAD(P)-dependent dehydrogenase (short-subunit alcohol dehydrogenase family)